MIKSNYNRGLVLIIDSTKRQEVEGVVLVTSDNPLIITLCFQKKMCKKRIQSIVVVL